MPSSFYTNVTSKDALKSTIDTDSQVYRWFTYLVVQPAVQEKLLTDKDLKDLYGKLKNIVSRQRILYSCVALYFISILFFFKPILLWTMIAFWWPAFHIHQTKKQYVNSLSLALLEKDFEEKELSQKTLYQIGEFYSRQYNIPSLVDVIFSLDTICRNTIIFGLIFFNFIHPFQIKIWEIFLYILITYIIVSVLINTSLIYRHLK